MYNMTSCQLKTLSVKKIFAFSLALKHLFCRLMIKAKYFCCKMRTWIQLGQPSKKSFYHQTCKKMLLFTSEELVTLKEIDKRTGLKPLDQTKCSITRGLLSLIGMIIFVL